MTLALAGVLFSFSPAPAAAQGESTPGLTVLKPGDAVQVTVWRNPEMSGEFQVAGDGTVRHPLYQHVVVAGMPMDEVTLRIRGVVNEYEGNPRVVVVPLLRVAVGGEVARPDLYTLAPEVTISQAVAAAGGVKEDGRVDRVRLLRDGQEILVDLTHPGEGPAQFTVRSGDQIVVDRSRSVVLRQLIAPAASLLTSVLLIIRNF